MDTLFIDWVSSTPGWNGFDLLESYYYSGMGNLILEFRYMGSSGTTINARAMALPSADRCLDGGYPSCPSGDLMSFLTSMRIHYSTMGVPPLARDPGMALQLMENPIGSIAHVRLSVPFSEQVSLRILDISGRVVSVPVPCGYMESGENDMTVDMNGLPPGVYVMEARSLHDRALCMLAKL